MQLHATPAVRPAELTGPVQVGHELLRSALDAVGFQAFLVEVGGHDCQAIVHANRELAVLVVKRAIRHAFSFRVVFETPVELLVDKIIP